MGEDIGITIRARLRNVGWVEFEGCRTYRVCEDGWIRIEPVVPGTNIVLNPEDVIMIGEKKDIEDCCR